MQFARQALAFGEPGQFLHTRSCGLQFEMCSLQFGVGTDLLHIQDEVCGYKQEQHGDIRQVPDTIPPVRLYSLRTGTSQCLNAGNAGDEKDDRTARCHYDRACLSEDRQGSEQQCEEET